MLEKRPLNGSSSCSSNINITIITINIIIHEIGEYDAVDMIKLFLYVTKSRYQLSKYRMGQKTDFLRVDNFATVRGKKACDMSNVS